MIKNTLALALMAASGLAQAATLNPNNTYDMSINTEGSCYLFGDCTGGTNNVNPGAVISIATTSDGAGGVDFTVTSATEVSYNQTVFGTTTTFNIGGFGSVDIDGNIVFTPTGRKASYEFHPYLGDVPFVIGDTTLPNASPDYISLTSGSMSAYLTDGSGEIDFTLTGSKLDDSLNAVILSASNAGFSTLPGFESVAYSEVWSVTFTETVPIPAAVWLFGSGLLALAGVARRR